MENMEAIKVLNKGRSVINRYTLELNGDKRFRGWKIGKTTVFFKNCCCRLFDFEPPYQNTPK